MEEFHTGSFRNFQVAATAGCKTLNGEVLMELQFAQNMERELPSINYGVKKALSQVNPSASKDFGMVLRTSRTQPKRLMKRWQRLPESNTTDK
jgi:hypothetical protein